LGHAFLRGLEIAGVGDDGGELVELIELIELVYIKKT